MFSPESHMDNTMGSQPKNPFHGIRRLARKSLGMPNLGPPEIGGFKSPDMAKMGGPEPGQQAFTLVNSFGGQNKGWGKPRF